MAAFERLYVEHGDRIRAICLALLRDRDDADDAAQQVFLSALRSMQSGTVPRDPGAWLATIARRECWARARRPAPSPLHEGLPDLRTEDPSATVVRRSELADTWETIAALPRRQREALLLREIRGLGYDELAETLRLSQPSVRSLLNRARRMLRAQVDRGAAALSSGPWLSLLARFLGDGPNPTTASIARTAAVGLGAVALTGGSVAVAPRPEAPPHRQSRPAPVHVRRARGVPAVRIEHRPSTIGVPLQRPSAESHASDRHGRSGEAPTSGSSGHDGGSGRSGSGDAVQVVTTPMTEMQTSDGGSGRGGLTDGGGSSDGGVSGGSSDSGSSDGGS